MRIDTPTLVTNTPDSTIQKYFLELATLSKVTDAPVIPELVEKDGRPPAQEEPLGDNDEDVMKEIDFLLLRSQRRVTYKFEEEEGVSIAENRKNDPTSEVKGEMSEEEIVEEEIEVYATASEDEESIVEIDSSEDDDVIIIESLPVETIVIDSD